MVVTKMSDDALPDIYPISKGIKDKDGKIIKLCPLNFITDKVAMGCTKDCMLYNEQFSDCLIVLILKAKLKNAIHRGLIE